MFNLRVLVSVGCASLVVGCALLPASVNSAFAEPAANPLGGDPVVGKWPLGGLSERPESACGVWPLEDTIEMRPNDKEICIKAAYVRLEPRTLAMPEPRMLTLESDSSQIGNDLVQLSSKGPKKATECTTTAGLQNAWVETYDGCLPNKTSGGRALLSRSSTFIEVRNGGGRVARWKFDK